MLAWVRRHPLLGLGPIGLTLLVTAAGCASGDDGIIRRGGDSGPGGLDSSAPAPDSGEPVGECSPPCASGDVCREGFCVSPGIDLDADGVDATTDCDDRDAAVGASAERECATACGVGFERCADGVWAACDAPAGCDCADGDPPRELACEMCGTRRQVCVGGAWVDDGGCMGQGSCAPGATEDGAACGCGGTERRTCGSDCTWGAFACVGGGTGTECTAGMTDSQTVACGRCNSGTRTRTRSCNASTCTWNAFVDGACTGESGCVPGEMRGGCDRSASGATTSCGVQVCNSSCTFGACQPAPGTQCLSEMGTNFQCCTPPGGGAGWQFCSSSTCNWNPCASHSCS